MTMTGGGKGHNPITDAAIMRLDPLFAAFSFVDGDHARQAWRALRDSDKTKGISAWTVRTSDAKVFAVVVLGEEQRKDLVDQAAEALMAQPGCTGNYILPKDVMDTLANRRYATLLREAQKDPSKREVRQEHNFGAGARLNPDGSVNESEDG